MRRSSNCLVLAAAALVPALATAQGGYPSRAVRIPVPPPIAAPVVFTPPARKCQFPLWGHNERPTQRFCDAPMPARAVFSVLIAAVIAQRLGESVDGAIAVAVPRHVVQGGAVCHELPEQSIGVLHDVGGRVLEPRAIDAQPDAGE